MEATKLDSAGRRIANAKTLTIQTEKWGTPYIGTLSNFGAKPMHYEVVMRVEAQGPGGWSMSCKPLSNGDAQSSGLNSDYACIDGQSWIESFPRPEKLKCTSKIVLAFDAEPSLKKVNLCGNPE